MPDPTADEDVGRYRKMKLHQRIMAKLEDCPHPRCDHRNPVGAKSCGRCKRLFADNPLWLNALVGLLACVAMIWGMTGD